MLLLGCDTLCQIWNNHGYVDNSIPEYTGNVHRRSYIDLRGVCIYFDAWLPTPLEVTVMGSGVIIMNT